MHIFLFAFVLLSFHFTDSVSKGQILAWERIATGSRAQNWGVSWFDDYPSYLISLDAGGRRFCLLLVYKEGYLLFQTALPFCCHPNKVVDYEIIRLPILVDQALSRRAE
jgi:hypothetical protein